MQIVPFVGKTVLSSDAVTIQINSRDQDRADDLILSTSAVTVVRDERTYQLARDAAGQLKAMLNEIGDSEKSAKRPFTAIGTKIGQLAKDVGGPVKAEHDRILRLCSAYVTKLEAERETLKAAGQLDQTEADKSLVPGGRVTHPWKFELIDVEAVIKGGAKRLLRIELDILACQDSVRAQLEIAPDQPPSLPGIKVTRETKVIVRATV
jgi:hypothetical protein